MSAEEEEATMELKGADNKDAEPRDAADSAAVALDDATEAEAAEADQDQDQDLDQEEQEKQPMTGGGDRSDDAPSAGSQSAADAAVSEKNGAVKLKIQDDAEEVKFTGLNKEELLRVAGTPGWVRIRWALLVVFWLGWLGILAGAVLIIVQAPRCRDLPSTSWWNDGPLYQLGKVQAFSESRNLKGVEQKVNSLSKLKVKGLVLGPIHVAPSDEPMNLRFEEISPDVGNLEQFKGLIQAAHKKGIFVVLDLTPNYGGTMGPWFANISVTNVAERLKSALVFWLNEGVDGVQLSGVERVAAMVPSLWADIRAIVQNGTADQTKRVLIGVTESSSAEDVSSLLSSTGVDLLISRVLSSASEDGMKYAQSVQTLYSSQSQNKLAWSMGRPAEGHLASLVGPVMVKLYQLMLLTLPGTPFINYGDEIGLMDEGTKFPKMVWDSEEEVNGTQQEGRAERLSSRTFFQSLSELRGKERPLLYGDFVLLSNSSSSMAYLRLWDQSVRYIAAFNWAEEATVLELNHAALPQQATVVVSTNTTALPVDTSVQLTKLQLGSRQAVLVQFPYTA